MPNSLAQERLLEIIKGFSQRKVLVVGDVIADKFIYGAISRVSREAPVLILRHEQTETIPGGAANCAVNLASLGARVFLVSATGADETAQALQAGLIASGVDCRGLSLSPELQTTTKVRVLAGQLHSTRQQVIRIDYEASRLSDTSVIRSIVSQIRERANDCDAIIISDYNYGLAGSEVIETIRQTAKRESVPVFVDSRFDLTKFSGFNSATPNEDEVQHIVGKVHSDIAQLAISAEQLRKQLGFRALLVTRGSQGMLLLEEGLDPLNLAAVGGSEAVDVTGAGDTVIATYALAVASGASFPDAARLANHAGGLVVMKRGTASISSQDLENSVLYSEAAS